jgi:hypothetical protein
MSKDEMSKDGKEIKNNGRVVDFFTVTDHAAAAKEWAEGNADLERVLNLCFKHRIATHACCAGHDGRNYTAYISFEDLPESRGCIESIACALYKSGCEFFYFADHCGENKPTFSFKDDIGEYTPATIDEIWDSVDKHEKVNIKTDMFKIIGDTIDEYAKRGDKEMGKGDIQRGDAGKGDTHMGKVATTTSPAKMPKDFEILFGIIKQINADKYNQWFRIVYKFKGNREYVYDIQSGGPATAENKDDKLSTGVGFYLRTWDISQAVHLLGKFEISGLLLKGK